MCLQPIPLSNPHHNRGKLAFSFKGSGVHYTSGNNFKWYLKDTSYTIPVPCGCCPQCLSRRQTDLIQRCEIEARDSWVYYGTLTYNPEGLPILQVGDYSFRYAEIKDVQDMIKRLRIDNVFGYPFRFFVVSERGEQKGRPHFHLQFYFKKKDIGDIKDARSFGVRHKWTLLQYWKRNLGDRNHVDYISLTTYRERWRNGKLNRNYDFHFVEPSISTNGCSDVAFYVTSYMLCDIRAQKKLYQALKLNYNERIAWDTYVKLRDKCVKSIGFGIGSQDVRHKDSREYKEHFESVKEYVRSFIDKSTKVGFPSFYLANGKGVPLSKYYRDKFYSVDDLERVYNTQIEKSERGKVDFHQDSNLSSTSRENYWRDFYRRQDLINSRLLINFLDV